VAGTNSFTAQFPQQLSLFAASSISPRMGIFSQLTYTDQEGTFAIDNIDVRYAGHATLHGKDVLYGMTLNNNPTVQDVWNSTPAWGFPFISSAVAPTPAAATKIEGAYAQSVAGLGAYAMVNNTLYAELTGYVAAPQGAVLPLDTSAKDTPRSVSPYWRVALQHQYQNTYLMVGAFGLDSHVYPTGVGGTTDHYSDVGVDAQLEQKVGEGMLIGRASFIQESQSYTASYTAGNVSGVSRSLHSSHANLTYQPNLTHALTVGTFAISGSNDPVLYPSGDVSGSAAGRPNSSGMIFDANANAWLNVRLGAQYIAYSQFNGSSSAYDVRPGGRSAKDNNTLYLYLWLAF
jgi:hypothetical protein